jgi:hypothetical protein
MNKMQQKRKRKTAISLAISHACSVQHHTRRGATGSQRCGALRTVEVKSLHAHVVQWVELGSREELGSAAAAFVHEERGLARSVTENNLDAAVEGNL